VTILETMQDSDMVTTERETISWEVIYRLSVATVVDDL